MNFRKGRKIVTEKSYYEDRIIAFSRSIDLLNYNTKYMYDTTDSPIELNRYKKRGKTEKNNLKIINEKYINRLKNKINYYKNKLKW